MKYEIGQKVETPFGFGIVTFLSNIGNDEIDSVFVSFKNAPEIEFSIKSIKPYKNPHEKLIELGYELIQGVNLKIYRHDKLMNFRVYDDNTISCNEIDLELAKIIKEYLEWLGEAK